MIDRAIRKVSLVNTTISPYLVIMSTPPTSSRTVAQRLLEQQRSPDAQTRSLHTIANLFELQQQQQQQAPEPEPTNTSDVLNVVSGDDQLVYNVAEDSGDEGLVHDPLRNELVEYDTEYEPLSDDDGTEVSFVTTSTDRRLRDVYEAGRDQGFDEGRQHERMDMDWRRRDPAFLSQLIGLLRELFTLAVIGLLVYYLYRVAFERSGPFNIELPILQAILAVSGLICLLPVHRDLHQAAILVGIIAAMLLMLYSGKAAPGEAAPPFPFSDSPFPQCPEFTRVRCPLEKPIAWQNNESQGCQLCTRCKPCFLSNL